VAKSLAKGVKDMRKRGCSSTDLVYNEIKNKITNYSLRPGHHLIVRQIAEEMGLSHTPVREAIHKLQMEGLVVIEQNRGAYVAPFDLEDMIEIYQIRRVLETYATSLAAERVTEQIIRELKDINNAMRIAAQEGELKTAYKKNREFHEALYKHCGNRKLCEMISGLWQYAQRLRNAILSTAGRLEAVIREHDQIIEALIDGDVKRTVYLVEEHLLKAEEAFYKAVEQDLVVF
jgi:DNA-binding GntR family transcriptional regulator